MTPRLCPCPFVFSADASPPFSFCFFPSSLFGRSCLSVWFGVVPFLLICNIARLFWFVLFFGGFPCNQYPPAQPASARPNFFLRTSPSFFFRTSMQQFETFPSLHGSGLVGVQTNPQRLQRFCPQNQTIMRDSEPSNHHHTVVLPAVGMLQERRVLRCLCPHRPHISFFFLLLNPNLNTCHSLAASHHSPHRCRIFASFGQGSNSK